jgi:hypothetical protein
MAFQKKVAQENPKDISSSKKHLGILFCILSPFFFFLRAETQRE